MLAEMLMFADEIGNLIWQLPGWVGSDNSVCSQKWKIGGVDYRVKVRSPPVAVCGFGVIIDGGLIVKAKCIKSWISC